MPPFEPGTLVNWIVSGVIGAIFGWFISWRTYLYQRKRDDIKWERRLTELEKQAVEARVLPATK